MGGNGEALLTHAGANVDVVGLQGLGRTGTDGRSHDTRRTSAWVHEQVAQVRSGAAHRVDPPELNALVQVVEVTDDRANALAGVRDQVPGLSAADAAETPYPRVGTIDEIVRHVRRCADRWGITYSRCGPSTGRDPCSGKSPDPL